MNTIPNVKVLHDFVMIRPMPMHLKKTADGIIIPGDMDKMAPKRATVVAAGPGVHKPNGTFVPGRFKTGDQVLYMERGIINVKVEGEDFFMLKQEDVIVKIGFDEPGPEETLVELSEAAFLAEMLRRTLITRLTSKGLVRLQDMLNPCETFISSDGDYQEIVNARSFMLDGSMVESQTEILSFEPPEYAKAFSMYKLNYAESPKMGETASKEVAVVLRLAFLKRTDLTLG